MGYVEHGLCGITLHGLSRCWDFGWFAYYGQLGILFSHLITVNSGQATFEVSIMVIGISLHLPPSKHMLQ